MNAITSSKPLQKAWAEILLIGIFISLLWLPALDNLLNLDHSVTPWENRLPAAFPRLEQSGFPSLQKYLIGLEAYFNDHFGFRKKLIQLFQSWKLRLYHDHGIYKVVIGPHNWLFLGESEMAEHFLGIARFTPQQLKSWQTLLEERRDWLAQHNIKYLFVIPPDKQTIYPDELPAWLVNAAPTNRETKLDQFLKYMQAHSTVPIVDLRQPLADARRIAPTYLKTDTHWNLLGGLIAYQELIKTLSQQTPLPPPLELKDFTWTNTPTPGGDLARMLGSDAAENNHFDFIPGSNLPVLHFSEITNVHSQWDVQSNWGPRKNELVVENSSSPGKTVILFHDSFGEALKPFLGYNFKRVAFVPDNLDFNEKLISENPPDIVIYEIVERSFNTQDPVKMMAKDALP